MAKSRYFNNFGSKFSALRKEMKFRFCGDLDCPDWVLAEIATLSKLSSVRIRVITVQIINFCIDGEFNYDKVIKIAKESFDGVTDLKGAVAAIHFVVANAAKHDLDEVSLVQEIQQLGLPKENSEAVGRQFRERKDALRLKFAEKSLRISRLVDVDWRVDALLANISSSDENASIAKPQHNSLVHLKMTVSESSQSTPNELAFEISPEKLDVLIHELTQVQSMMQNMQG